ncbi:MAG: YncE family protein, partial [Chloroflexi bacterium]|nr:YncE family protein [Chloroflexota bacterium]
TLAPTDAPLTAPTIKEKFFLRDLPGAGRHPIDLASVGDKIYALNTETQNVAVIQNDRAIKYIAVGKQPAALAADAAQKRVYVSNAGDKSISLIADDQLALTQSIGEEARALIFFENRLWAGLANSATIITLDPTTLQIQNRIAIPGAFSIISLAGDAQNHRVYANIFDKTAVIDSTTLRVGSTINTKGSYSTLLAQPATDSVLVAIYDSASATQFLVAYNPSTGAERARVKLGGDPRGAIMNRDGSRIYVANSFTNDVSVIDARNFTSLATISIGLKPNAVALDENARRLYVANYESDSISAINSDTNEIVATIPLAMLVTAFETNDAAQRTYIANASTDSVFVMEGARVVKEISVGRHPIDLARDATSNRVFVAHQADGTLAIIDENNFSVSTTKIITRPLTTVAVDAPRARLFANDIVLDLKTLAPIGKLILRGQTVQSNLAPDFVRVNAAANRVYALGSNGVPGSNGRRVIYSVDGNNLQQRAPLSFNGNIHFIAFDPETNRVYGAGTHPLALTNEFSAWDLNDAKIFSLALAARTTGLAYNPQTHHLFLAHAASFGSTPNPNDNTIQILDTTTFGEITRLNVQAPGLIARIGNTIYVAGRDDGSITRIQDANIAAPPAPSPTFTLTPFQLLTPARTPTR